MITGDHPATAMAIAQVSRAGRLGRRHARFRNSATPSPSELAARLRTVRVFARIIPEQKLMLVQGFKAAGEVVAMTGDGVNDAPALEAAHIA